MGILRYGVAVLLLALAQPAEAQYRRRTQELPPIYAVNLSFGALLPYDETVTPVHPPEPDINLRSVRSVGTSPWVSLTARFGRGIGVYANGSAAFAPEAELSGTDPLTGEAISGTTETGTITVVSAGVSFAPLRGMYGLRIEGGPAWLDMGSGGSYFAGRGAVQLQLFTLGDRGRVFAAWDAYLGGSQDTQGEVEYQLRKGNVMGLRAGFELAW